MLRRKLVVENPPVRVGCCRQSTIEMERLGEILVQMQTHLFARLPAGTGDGDGGTWCVIALICVKCDEAVIFAASLTTAARDYQDSLVLCSTHDSGVAGGRHRSSCCECPGPWNVKL